MGLTFVSRLIKVEQPTHFSIRLSGQGGGIYLN